MAVESIILFIVSAAVLVKSASYAVKYIVNVANYLRFSAFFVTFFVAGLISITPELMVAINSALIGSPSVGLGTLIGSNIADLTIVIGIVALVGTRIRAGQKGSMNSVYFFVATSLPVLLMLDGTLSRDDGIVLVIAFLVYMHSMVRREKVFGGKKKGASRMLYKDLGLFLAAMALLFVSSHFIVESAVALSEEFLIPSIIIGLFLISIGTTLPELTFSLRAVLAKHKEVALGDILGNVAADSTLSIGVLAIISPVSTGFSVFATAALFMIFSALLVVTLLNETGRITRNESYMLFFLYALFAIIELKSVFV